MSVREVMHKVSNNFDPDAHNRFDRKKLLPTQLLGLSIFQRWADYLSYSLTNRATVETFSPITVERSDSPESPLRIVRTPELDRSSPSSPNRPSHLLIDDGNLSDEGDWEQI